MRRKDKSKRFSIILVSVLIVSSMIVSIFAILINNPQSGLTYNNYAFTQTNTGYTAKIDGKYMNFYYYPGNIESINMSPDITNAAKNAQAIAFTFDANTNSTDELTYIDTMRYNLATQINKPVYFGVLNKSEAYPLPVIKCENATIYMPVFVINISIDTGFARSPSSPYCFVINAKLANILAASDRFVYEYYGVMN